MQYLLFCRILVAKQLNGITDDDLLEDICENLRSVRSPNKESFGQSSLSTKLFSSADERGSVHTDLHNKSVESARQYLPAGVQEQQTSQHAEKLRMGDCRHSLLAQVSHQIAEPAHGSACLGTQWRFCCRKIELYVCYVLIFMHLCGVNLCTYSYVHCRRRTRRCLLVRRIAVAAEGCAAAAPLPDKRAGAAAAHA